MIPIVIEPLVVDDELRTDLDAIEAALKEHESKVLCIISTTSCFAPRAIDSVTDIGLLAKKHKVAHVVNNAYGL